LHRTALVEVRRTVNRCFVIQPFDKARFDKMFEDLYKPAIEAAGLEPYRVDKDPNADVPITAIEAGIKDAAVCLADITTDNPNVWYELGFAFAAGRQVVMVSAADRAGKKYPFDIQHRAVVTYAAEAPSDFARLQTDITARLKAAVDKAETIEELSSHDQIAPVDGLSQYELVVLAVMAAGLTVPDDAKSVYALQNDARKAGITELAYSLAVRKLVRRKFLQIVDESNDHGELYKAARLTESGWTWIEDNEDRFILKKPTAAAPDLDDDIPF
jgi:hypothetical protein